MELDLDLRKIIPVAAILLFVFGGLFLAQVTTDGVIKTQMECPCTAGNTTYDGEITCNEITTSDYIFRTGLLDIYDLQQGQEVIMCDNGEREGMTINESENSGYKIASPLLGIR